MTKCRKCKKQSVDWEDKFKVFMCTECGWVDKEKWKRLKRK